MLYLATLTPNRAAVCLPADHIAALWEFWTDWLPTETPFLPQNVEPRLGAMPTYMTICVPKETSDPAGAVLEDPQQELRCALSPKAAL